MDEESWIQIFKSSISPMISHKKKNHLAGEKNPRIQSVAQSRGAEVMKPHSLSLASIYQLNFFFFQFSDTSRHKITSTAAKYHR